MKIALAGNPNSGKTTMFNALTGKNEKVGNWAGVTVDKKEHPIKKSLYNGDKNITVVDLPGAYSMSPFTSEESITSEYVQNERPDAIINIVDGTNLSRSLFFTTQLLELGIPVVVALNKADVNKKKETTINAKILSEKLGCPVFETVSTSAKGVKAVVDAAVASIGTEQKAPFVQSRAELCDKEAAKVADKERFDFVNQIVVEAESRKVFTKDKNIQDKVDAVLTNKWAGIPIFAAVMFAVFWISQAGPAVWVADWLVGVLEAGQGAIGDLIPGDGVWEFILVDGVLSGIIAVIGFLPLVMVMYFLIALLEDCGYMARATVVLDPIFKRVGLSGKSVIPFVVGTGCSIPGVMACRTIRNERERRATAMLAPFMPCGAKLPVIALFAGAFFGRGASWVGPLMYLVGIVIIFFGALLVNLLTGYKARRSFFIIEIPEYKIPSVVKAAISMCQRGWSYIVKAGTIILVCNFVITFMSTFNWRFERVATAESILASVATPFAYLIAPIIGYVSWQLAAAAISGFIAKENVVGTLGSCFLIENLVSLDYGSGFAQGAENVVQLAFGAGSGGPMYAVAALSFLMFNLFTPPCFAAIGAMNAELKSKKWLFAGIGLQFSVGYTVSFLVFFFGSLFTKAGFASIWMPILGWLIVGCISVVFAVMIIRNQKLGKIKTKKKVTIN